VPAENPSLLSIAHTSADSSPRRTPIACSSPARQPVIAPLGAERYLLRVTLTASGHDKLERARALLRHQVPNGDPAVVVERALSVLVDQLERTKFGATLKPRTSNATTISTTRHVPAAVKRAVWARDGGRCAFVGIDGRCGETSMLEFHHVTPFAVGGATDAANLQLRCRAHNAYEVTLFEQSAAPPLLQSEHH
jgi:5-methylcytosine-specific restriction endonuclease McrA